MSASTGRARRQEVDALWDELHRRYAARGYPGYAVIERRTGIPKSTLNDWFTRRTVPPWDRLAKLLDYFGADEPWWRSRWQAAYSAAHHTRSIEPSGRTADRAEPSVPVTVPVPRQLPPLGGPLAGRGVELSWLRERLRRSRVLPAGSVEVVVIAGSAGVGKTALALAWGHSVAAEFPDGQLYLDLHGHAPDANPMTADAALTRMLRALGTPPPLVPLDAEEKEALYRSLLADRRMLVVLDDAATAAHVRPLVPAGRGCLVVVTSRTVLPGLVPAREARHLTLDVLSPADAVALLDRYASRTGTPADGPAVAELARRCAYLPLALRVAAAEVELHQYSIGEVVDRLAAGEDTADPALTDDVTGAARSAFWLSYRNLRPEQQQAFRRIGLALTPDVTADLLEPLAGLRGGDAERMLDGLARVHLLQRRDDGVFRMHDLLRAFARARAATEDGPEETGRRRRLLLGWYLQRARAAVEVLVPHLVRLPAEAAPPAGKPATPEDAGIWLERHRHGLVTAVRVAAADGAPEVAWRLADTLRGWYLYVRYGAEWLGTATDGLAAAQAAGDRPGQAATLLSLGQAHFRTGSCAAAVEHLDRAVDLAAAAGWTAGRSAALRMLGLVWQDLGDVPRSVAHLERSLELDQATGDWHGEAANLNNLGGARYDEGRLAEAADLYQRAQQVHQEHDNDRGVAIASNNLAMIQVELGRLPEAADLSERAVTLFRRLGSREGEAEGLETIARVELAAGRPREALETGRQALAIARTIGDHRIAADAAMTAGRAERALGRTGPAATLLHEALRDAEQIRYARGQDEARLLLAELAG